MSNELQDLNDMLAGRTIASVEAGSTHGWILRNLLPVPEDEGCRVFMTIRIETTYHETEKEEEADPRYSSAAIHYKQPTGAGMVYMIRPITEGAADLAAVESV